MARPLVFDQISDEQFQGLPTRKPLLETLGATLERPVVSFFTSFRYPVMIDDSDADMLEGVLKSLDLSQGLALVISSPGGDGLAAERIINLCRSYSGTREYWAVVPSKAKSAATMICFGASKIIMGASSELGPVDPQVALDGRLFSVYNIVRSYDDLFKRAVAEEENLEPYLQQLANYDEREITEFRAELALSEDIAARSLASGMMGDTPEDEIKGHIQIFLTPERTKRHGRPIYRDEAASCGLAIEAVDIDSALWDGVYELYARTSNVVDTRASKCVESRDHSYSTPPLPPSMEEE